MDSGSLYSNMGPGMLGLEMSLHHQIPQQNTHHHMHQQPPSQPQPQPQPPPHHPIVSYAHQENVDNQQQALRQVFPFGNNKAKNQSLNFSDDDEPVPGVSAENNSTDDGKRNSNKTCPWQRMKWTDNMVRLLILMVYYVGDEVGSEGNNNMDPSGKKKSGSGGGVGGGGSVGVLQKKGKWKSVSRAMMERGFYVSPQQCEDKFNDLNKRYKRVNDILGKGTSCKVVENQKLLDTMDHLSPKMKEEVKKLLNSKHLFFREMCAYHNSCGHNSGGGASGSGVANSQAHQNQLEQQQRCLHSSENANARIGASLVEGPKMSKGASGENEDEEDEEDDDEDEEDDDDEVSGARGHDHDHQSHEEDEDLDEGSRKRQRKLGTSSPMVQQFCTELANVVQDRGRSLLDKRQWMKTKMMQLEEQHVTCLSQAFDLQKQRLKWKKFISKKEREMEREKLINERKKLENERMVLLLKQKELELLDYHQHYPNNNNRNSDPSSVTG